MLTFVIYICCLHLYEFVINNFTEMYVCLLYNLVVCLVCLNVCLFSLRRRNCVGRVLPTQKFVEEISNFLVLIQIVVISF